MALHWYNNDLLTHIGADYLIYQDLEDLVAASRVGNPKIEQFCDACFSGHYPTEDVTPEMLDSIEQERLGNC